VKWTKNPDTWILLIRRVLNAVTQKGNENGKEREEKRREGTEIEDRYSRSTKYLL